MFGRGTAHGCGGGGLRSIMSPATPAMRKRGFDIAVWFARTTTELVAELVAHAEKTSCGVIDFQRRYESKLTGWCSPEQAWLPP